MGCLVFNGECNFSVVQAMKKTFIIVSHKGGTVDLFVVCVQRIFGLSDCQLQGVHWFSYVFQCFDDDSYMKVR